MKTNKEKVAQQLRTLADQVESGELEASLGFRSEMVGVRQPERAGELVIEMIGTTVHGMAILLCGEDAPMPTDADTRLRAALGFLVPKAVSQDDIIMGGAIPYTRSQVEQAALGYHNK